MKTPMEDILPSHPSLCWALLSGWGSTHSHYGKRHWWPSRTPDRSHQPSAETRNTAPASQQLRDSLCPVPDSPRTTAPSQSPPGFANTEFPRSDGPIIVKIRLLLMQCIN